MKLHSGSKIFSVMVLGVLLSVVPPSGAFSQAILPPTVDLTKQQKDNLKLTRDNLEKAKDLQDVIQQIEKLAYDYQSYLGDCHGSEICEKTNEALYKMLVKFDVGSYYLSPTKLRDDIKGLTDMLGENELELQKAHNNAKLYHLTKSLRQQLELYSDILKQDVCPELRTDTASAEKIQAYLIAQMTANQNQRELFKEIAAKNKAVIEKLKTEIEAQRIAVEASNQLKDQHIYVLKALDMLKDSLSSIAFVTVPGATAGTLNVVTVPKVPEVPHVVSGVKPPKAPVAPNVVVVGQDRTYSSGSGQAGASKEFEDSMQVYSKKLPIYINNQTGTLVITGVDENVVRVSFSVKVSADDNASANRLINEITVDLSNAANGVYVNSHFPAISDPKRSILSSRLEVTVPKSNPLVCESAFGQVDITGVQSGLIANTNYSDVTIGQVSGQVKLVSKMGKTDLSDVSGPIDVKNSLGDIVLSDCSGSFELENSYAMIELDGCSGKATIRNSGEVNISGHKGDVTVANQNGQVTVSDVVGNLDIKNSYKPLSITNIDGTAKIENVNSSIDMDDIHGMLTAASKFGSISGRYLNGPIVINSDRGNVAVDVNQYLAGPSTITSTYGMVNLQLSQNANVLVTATADGGVIKSDYNTTIEKGKGSSQTMISVGTAKIPLHVKGTNSTIVISENK